jgi:hypothetical protein
MNMKKKKVFAFSDNIIVTMMDIDLSKDLMEIETITITSQTFLHL